MADTGSLRPVRRPRLPGRSALLRAALVAALLGLAAAVLHAPPGCPPPPAASPGSAATRPPGGPPTGSGTAPSGTSASHGRASPPGPGAPPSALPLPDGAVGVPIRLAEPAALAVVRPGARVDLLAVPAGGPPGGAGLVAPGALVLDVIGADATDGSSALYLALSPPQARKAVTLPDNTRFAIMIRN
ncbi:flagellar biosynthesis protein FlgA [Micromonospora okii]|uniref:flagellar biosynthesis protein FlgA n=1 Tax=Micromonospora okii TaxID=1182970 RepID=UPI001E586FA2|nr:flagellar biosynthesis protein FlgA [Micromonospora okii]